MQLKMGGKFHLKLNIGKRPIANKYREGKMKRTLKRELKVREIVKKETIETSIGSEIKPLHVAVVFSESSQHQFLALDKAFFWADFQQGGLRNSVGDWGLLRLQEARVTFRCTLAGNMLTVIESRLVRAALLLRKGCWRNGFKRPVLKHGPRSLTHVRVFECQTRMRNENDWWELFVHHQPIF